MPLTLTNADLGAVQRAARGLVSPLAYVSTEARRADVNRQLREPLQAGSAGGLLPGTSGPLLYSDEHDPGELARGSSGTAPRCRGRVPRRPTAQPGSRHVLVGGHGAQLRSRRGGGTQREKGQ